MTSTILYLNGAQFRLAEGSDLAQLAMQLDGERSVVLGLSDGRQIALELHQNPDWILVEA